MTPPDDTPEMVEVTALIAAINNEMQGRARGFADTRGELLFRCRDRLASTKALREALEAAADALDLEGKAHKCPAALAAGVAARAALASGDNQ